MPSTTRYFLALLLVTLAGASTAGAQGSSQSQMAMNEPTTMVGGQAMFRTRDIVDNAINSADHTTLVAAVKAAGVVETLKGEGPFTVLGLRSISGGERHWEACAFAVKYDFSLFSNFTFFLDDPVNGDGINQTDDRWIAGANGSYALPSRFLGADGRTTVGLGVRSD
jgi:hypothetical protein